MKNIVVIISIILVAALLIIYFHFSGKEYIVRIPEKDIQIKMGEKLPITKSYFIIFQITLENPRVMLEDGSNRINAGLDIVLNITVNNEPEPLGGSINISGGLKYINESGEFYLTDPIIDEFNVQGVPEKYTDKVNLALTKALSEYYATYPVYSLSSLDAGQAITKLVLKDVVVENKELVVTLGI